MDLVTNGGGHFIEVAGQLTDFILTGDANIGFVMAGTDVMGRGEQ